MRRLSAIAALAVLWSLAWAGSAIACSCAPQAPGESFERADAAIVGRLVEATPHGRLQADYRYEVRRVYRGGEIELGQMLVVRSARRAATCALPRRLDRRYGLFLIRDHGRWLGGVCGVIEPRRLWAAAQRQPRVGDSGADGSFDCGAAPALGA